MKYLTNNKKNIMDYIKRINGSFNSQKLYEIMHNNNEKVGLTTIYRYLDELEHNGVIKKFYDNKNIANYEYLEKCDHNNHFYLKCNKCGELIHIDCDCIIELQEHIFKKHNFKSDNKNIIIHGLCKKCNGGI